VGLTQAGSQPDATLERFLNETNQQLAVIYDQAVLAQLLNELRGPNDLVALLEIEVTDDKLVKYVRTLTTRKAKSRTIPSSSSWRTSSRIFVRFTSRSMAMCASA